MVTIFKNFNEVVEHKTIPTILDEIKTGKYLHAIVYLRKSLAEDKLEAYNKAKKSLPAFTPSGKFIDGRKVELLAEYSNFMILDIDKLSPEDLNKTIEIVKNCEFTYASFISPSGNGLKILVKTANLKTEHKETFLLIQTHYETLLNLEIDKSGKDISRLCFYSHDENLYLNEDSKVFKIQNEIEVIAPLVVCSPLLRRGAGGEEWDLIYNHCIKFTEKKVQFIDGSRNVFVHQLACNLNRKAMPLDEAMNFILNDFGFDEKEVKQAVNSAYGNIHEFGNNNNKTTQNENKKKKSKELLEDEDDDDDDKPRPTQIDKLENFLSGKYIFRHNIVSGKLEFQIIDNSGFSSLPFGKGRGWALMNDFIENSMLRECLKARIKTNLSSLRNLLYSDFCQLFNPFEDYFNSLPVYQPDSSLPFGEGWGGADYITQLANTITTTKQELWQQCFKKWLVAMVGCVLDDKVINHTVIVFSGKQGLGKTTWVEKLVPKQLKEYLFSGTINPNNKDTLVQLSECMLINLDELENLNRSEIGSLKEIITKTQIRMRKAYGHNNETMPRRASFAGSVNTAQFLNDTTGSRRFLCFELEDIKYQHNADINLAFSQALFLFKNGFKFWFDQEEIKSITENNEQYQLHSPEEELLLTWFSPCEREKANAFLNASQIAVKIAEKAKINITDGTINKLGKALNKHNFIRLKKNGIAVYALIEISWEEVDLKSKISED